MEFLLFVILLSMKHLEFVNCDTTVRKRNSEESATTKLRNLEEKLFEHILDTYPEFATTTGERGIDGRLETFTWSELDRRQKENENMLKEAESIEISQLNKTEQFDLKILMAHIRTFVDGYEWRHWGNLNPINFMEGPLKHLEWIRTVTKEDEENILSRIQAFPKQLKQEINFMKVAVELKRTNHRYSMVKSLEKIYEDARYLLGLEHYFYFMDNGTEADDVNSTDENLIKVINDIGVPFSNLHEFLETTYLPASRENESLSSLPGGLEYYHACLKFHLGVSLTPQNVHDIGLREVKRIEKMMKKVIRHTDFPGGDLPQFYKYLRSVRYLQSHNRTELVGRYYKALNRSKTKLWHLFKEIPLENVRIIPLNDPKLAFMGAYSQNKFFLNLHNSENTSSIGVLPLTFHEANPGHHFQDSYANLQPLPRYRQHLLYARRYAVPTTYPTYMAYTEGWALYAEQLGMEMGLYNTPLDILGKYISEILRALRLVLDTGIHALGWTKQKAIDYLAKYTDLSYTQMSAEVDRYITWPGHSCSYKIGEMKIKELRRRSETKLGNLFNVKEFHDQVLRTGPISLSVLEDIIDDWINNTFATSDTTDHDNKHINDPQSGQSRLNMTISETSGVLHNVDLVQGEFTISNKSDQMGNSDSSNQASYNTNISNNPWFILASLIILKLLK